MLDLQKLCMVLDMIRNKGRDKEVAMIIAILVTNMPVFFNA